MRLQRQFRLRPSMIILFMIMALPFLITLIVLTYTTTSKAVTKTSEEMVERFNSEIIKNLQQTLDPVITLTRSAAALSKQQPEFFKKDTSWDLLRTHTEHSPDVFSAYIGFEDGSFRAVYRASEKIRFFGQATPQEATFAYRYREPGGKLSTSDRLHLLDSKQQVLERRIVETAYDPRLRPWYQTAAVQKKSIVVGPIVFASNGEPGLTFATPVIVNNRVIAVIGMDVTLSSMQKFLTNNRISENAISLILDSQMRVVASSKHPDEVEKDIGKSNIPQITDMASTLPRQALLALPSGQFRGGFQFDSLTDGTRHMAIISDAHIDAPTDWRVLVIAPATDFLKEISENNLIIACIGALAIAIQVLMMYFISKRIARPLEELAEQVDDIEQLRFDQTTLTPRSSFSEIDRLAVSVDRMKKAIGAFAAFVPVDLVRGLLRSGQQLELGGRSQFLTIMFCDLESFSTLSENTPSQELLLRVSKYLEITTRAINEELGTVDKFIGDGVMAFWGAPQTLDNHGFHACSAALKIQERMDQMNQIWIEQGLAPLKVRIGIHSDAVLVGNIGSHERMSYTVMGDGVNIAARLEGVNKELGTRICISKAVFRESGEKLQLRRLDDVIVKGRKASIEIYELLGLKD